MPPPRHAYFDAAAEHGETALNQQRFLELRDRVLSRTEAYTQPGGVEDPLRRYRPPYRGDGSTAMATSYTPTITATSSCPSSYTAPSSRLPLFDNYEPNQRRFGGGKCPYDPQQRRQLQPHVDAYMATVTRTSVTSSTGQSMSDSTSTTSSYQSPSTYTSYDYNYSATCSTMWRTGETTSAGSTACGSSLAQATRPRSDPLAHDDGRKHLCASHR